MQVPDLVDQTGAGNTFCGGFLVGYVRSGEVATAGCFGAAAASFTLEYVGCAQIPDNLDTEWQRRLDEARQWCQVRAALSTLESR